MGNRAVITFGNSLEELAKNENTKLGIYLHWNGGPESVVAFIDAAKHLKYRQWEHDYSYCLARFTGMLCHFMGGYKDTTSVGINVLSKLDLDNGDNGVYVIGKDWELIEATYYADAKDRVREWRMYDQYIQIFNKLTEYV